MDTEQQKRQNRFKKLILLGRERGYLKYQELFENQLYSLRHLCRYDNNLVHANYELLKADLIQEFICHGESVKSLISMLNDMGIKVDYEEIYECADYEDL
jgi:hypothetical protein